MDQAREDLEETLEIAGRGAMLLSLADHHLERARLELAQIPGVVPPDEWTLALRRAGAADPSAAAEPAATTQPGKSWWPWGSRRANSKPSPTGAPVAGVPSTLTEGDRGRVAAVAKDVEASAKLIDETGYHRRDEEVGELRVLLGALTKK